MRIMHSVEPIIEKLQRIHEVTIEFGDHRDVSIYVEDDHIQKHYTLVSFRGKGEFLSLCLQSLGTNLLDFIESWSSLNVAVPRSERGALYKELQLLLIDWTQHSEEKFDLNGHTHPILPFKLKGIWNLKPLLGTHYNDATFTNMEDLEELPSDLTPLGLEDYITEAEESAEKRKSDIDLIGTIRLALSIRLLEHIKTFSINARKTNKLVKGKELNGIFKYVDDNESIARIKESVQYWCSMKYIPSSPKNIKSWERFIAGKNYEPDDLHWRGNYSYLNTIFDEAKNSNTLVGLSRNVKKSTAINYVKLFDRDGNPIQHAYKGRTPAKIDEILSRLFRK